MGNSLIQKQFFKTSDESQNHLWQKHNREHVLKQTISFRIAFRRVLYLLSFSWNSEIPVLMSRRIVTWICKKTGTRMAKSHGWNRKQTNLANVIILFFERQHLSGQTNGTLGRRCKTDKQQNTSHPICKHDGNNKSSTITSTTAIRASVNCCCFYTLAPSATQNFTLTGFPFGANTP